MNPEARFSSKSSLSCRVSPCRKIESFAAGHNALLTFHPTRHMACLRARTHAPPIPHRRNRESNSQMTLKLTPSLIAAMVVASLAPFGVQSTRMARAERSVLAEEGQASSASPQAVHRRAHAHNDYAHDRPLHAAIENGFCSVEADIFLINGQLLVGHDRTDGAERHEVGSKPARSCGDPSSIERGKDHF